MSKVFLKGTASRFLGYVIIAMQGVLLALLAFDMLNTDYREAWNRYGKDRPSVTIYLEEISEEQGYEVKDCFNDAAANGHAFFIKKEELRGATGDVSGLKFGVFGDFESNDVSFRYSGSEIVGKDMIRALLSSDDPEATLGVDKGSAFTIKDIPNIPFGDRVVIKKLDSLTSENNSMSGEYTILCNDTEVISNIVSKCAGILNVSEDDIVKATRGGSVTGSVKSMAVIGSVAAVFLIQVAFYIVLTLRAIDKLGKMILLGWSRSSFAFDLFQDFIWYSVFVIPGMILAGSLMSASSLRKALIPRFMLFGFGNLLLTLVAVGISLLIIFSISPTGAIKKRYPTRTLYGLGIVGYLAVSIAVIVIGLQIDKPIRKISENRKLMKSWEEVSDYLVMGSIEIGEDGSTFAGDSRSMDQDIFDWYKSIYKNDGVYLVHTDYYDDELIEAWREYGAYKDVPTEALWMFTYSESYARKMGLKVDDEAYTRADSGVRLYLIPETWTTERKEAVKKWLIEFSTNSIHEGDIDTIFNKERQFEFIEYTPEKELFTWGLTQDVSKYCKDPVILICTPENSTFFINESLKASGLDGYFKMDPSVVETGILSDGYMAKYHLKDNHLNYLKVEKYMDGIRDDLAAAVGAFVAAFAILSVIVIGLMLCLASIFSLANRNRLNVKKFLGYDFFRMYGSPLSSLFLVSVLEVLFLLIKGARYGIFMILVLIVLEFIIFKKYMTGQELSHVISDFKEE